MINYRGPDARTTYISRFFRGRRVRLSMAYSAHMKATGPLLPARRYALRRVYALPYDKWPLIHRGPAHGVTIIKYFHVIRPARVPADTLDQSNAIDRYEGYEVPDMMVLDLNTRMRY